MRGEGDYTWYTLINVIFNKKNLNMYSNFFTKEQCKNETHGFNRYLCNNIFSDRGWVGIRDYIIHLKNFKVSGKI